MNTLEKAISQKHITRDTVPAQFCSDHLKEEILRLFDLLEDATKTLTSIDNDRIRAHHKYHPDVARECLARIEGKE